jgi:hypothetical protein
MSMIKYQYLAKLCRFHYVTIFLKLGLVKVFCVWLFKSLVIQYSGPSNNIAYTRTCGLSRQGGNLEDSGLVVA